ncbi:MAG: hypothetical protein RR646_04240 [Erysipelotrichaceae bacterium]
MGLGYQLNKALHHIKRLLPYKQRKPIIVITSIFGLYFFFNAMLRITGAGNLIYINTQLQLFLNEVLMVSKSLILLIIVLVLMIVICVKNYSSFQYLISLLYLAILVLSFIKF